MNSFDFPLFAGQVGLGALLGAAVGYTVKKTLKLGLILIAVILALLIGLGKLGIITIHWESVEALYENTLQGSPSSWLEGIIAWFSTSIAVAGGFTGGFLLGFRYG